VAEAGCEQETIPLLLERLSAAGRLDGALVTIDANLPPVFFVSYPWSCRTPSTSNPAMHSFCRPECRRDRANAKPGR
jgi:hypothetical protein